MRNSFPDRGPFTVSNLSYAPGKVKEPDPGRNAEKRRVSAVRRRSYGENTGFGGKALGSSGIGPGAGLQTVRRGVSGGGEVHRHLGPGAPGGAGAPGGLRQGVGQVGYAHPAHAARADEDGGDPPVRPAVPGRPGPASPGGRGRAGHRHRRGPGGGAGGPVDSGEGRVEGAGQAAVDLLPDRQGHPGGLPEPAPRSGIRRPVPLCPGPQRGRLAGGPQRHPGPDVQAQRPALRRAGADPHPGPHCGAGGGHPPLRPPGVLDGHREAARLHRHLAGSERPGAAL